MVVRIIAVGEGDRLRTTRVHRDNTRSRVGDRHRDVDRLADAREAVRVRVNVRGGRVESRGRGNVGTGDDRVVAEVARSSAG